MNLKHATAEELLAEIRERISATERAEAAEAKCAQLRKQRDLFWSQRDALQARIDAGVRVYRYQGSWCTAKWTADTDTALLIDRQPIDHFAEPGKMVDEDRVGKADRRGGYAKGSCYRVNQTDDTRGEYRTAVPNTRRKTPGTKADRKPSWIRADGSTNPRTGERRKVEAKRCDTCSQPCTSSQDHCYYNIRGYLHDNRRDPYGANDRRKKP